MRYSKSLILVFSLHFAAGLRAEVIPPEETLRRAIEVQAQGRLDDFTGFFALDRFGEPAQALFRTRLRQVQGERLLEGLSFNPVAVGLGDEGRTATVRAEVSFSMNLNGSVVAVKHGVLAVLVLEGEQWKILAISPDDIHDLALLEEQTATSAAVRSKTGQLTQGLADYRDLDARISSAMRDKHFNEKAVLDAAMAGIGQTGPIGDTIAVTYGVIDVACDTWELVKESWTYGSSGLLPLKVRKVGLGVLQVLAEPVPFLDAQADAIAWIDDQLIYNAEMLRALNELRMQVKNASQGDLPLNPRLYLLRDLTEWHYPAGLDQVGEEGGQHSFGLPLARIDITAPDVYGRHIPFRVAGELTLPSDSPAAIYAVKWGGERRGDAFHIPVDVTHLVAESKEDGDMILEGFGRYRKQGASFRFLNWDATCRRGIEKISVKLRSGEATPPVTIVNRLMNAVTELRVKPLWPEKEMAMQPGQSIGIFRAMGWGKEITEERFLPDLTGLGACFDTKIADSSVAGLEANAEGYSVKALKNGSTRWDLLLGGSIMPELGDVRLSIPIQVGPKVLDELQTMRLVMVSIRGEFTYEIQNNGTKKVESVAYGNYYNFSTEYSQGVAQVPLKWAGPHFLAEGQMNNGNLKFKVEGEVNTTGSELLWASIAWDYSASWQQHFMMKIQGPGSIPLRSGTKFTYELRGATVPSFVKEFNETYKSGNLISNYKSVNWQSATIQPEILIMFKK